MNDNRRKLTGILKLLYENTDAEHSMDTYQIMDALESMGYGRPDRKTIDANIKFIIEDLGMGILKEKGKPNRYKWVHREFDLIELKMLVDAVHSSRFISSRKSREIIVKLKDLTSVHQASTLNREMYTSNNFKRDGSDSLHTADVINEAIKSRHRVRFLMSEYDLNKKEVIKNAGKVYEVSPYALLWNNDFYYMLGMPTGGKDVRPYRIDRIKSVEQTNTEVLPAPYGFSVESFCSRVFDLKAGETREVILSCKDSMIDEMVDCFGKDFYLEKDSIDTFKASVTVDISPAFFAWVFKSGGDVRILEPAYVRSEFEEMLRSQLASGN